ncbi:hypothetical protein PHLGIDRAFT_119738 [Phlebiopsis gigantea 11061_1 CR5-6]|uniref:Uncharacterized protein n=1 Tax=Phlebiopsis gigantea (strain 11061_1 CR5-6) TaxID=745531 RepID=A0A0C3PHW0_PHLG1|nr:hypothetical protein PHLGIDRAFT_119738 [Phlebiopsis gigantea 11061_1 CR5-6]
MSTLTLPVSFVEALAIGKESRTAAISLLFYDHIINLDREYYALNADCPSYPTTTGKFADRISVQAGVLTNMLLCALEIVVMAVLVGVTMSHLERVPILSTANGCAYQGLLKASSLIWIPGLIFEPILFLLVAYKAWGSNKRYPTIPIVRQIARDSLFYFVAVFAELLASAVVWLHAPQYINIFNPVFAELLVSTIIWKRSPQYVNIMVGYPTVTLGMQADVEHA